MIINVNDGQYIIEVNFNLYNGGTNLLTLYAYSNSTNEEINIDEINYNEVLNIYLNSMEYDIFELQFINLGDNPQKYGQTFVIEYKLNLNNLSLELVDFQPSNYFEEYDKLDISITKLEEPTPTETTVNIIVYGGIIALVIAIVEKLTNIFVSMVRGKTRL